MTNIISEKEALALLRVGALYRLQATVIARPAHGAFKRTVRDSYLTQGEVVMLLEIGHTEFWTFKILHEEKVLVIAHTNKYALEALGKPISSIQEG